MPISLLCSTLHAKWRRDAPSPYSAASRTPSMRTTQRPQQPILRSRLCGATCHSLTPPRVTFLCHVPLSHTSTSLFLSHASTCHFLVPRATLSRIHVSTSLASTCRSPTPPRVTLVPRVTLLHLHVSLAHASTRRRGRAELAAWQAVRLPTHHHVRYMRPWPPRHPQCPEPAEDMMSGK